MVRAYFTAFEFTHQMSQCSATHCGWLIIVAGKNMWFYDS